MVKRLFTLLTVFVATAVVAIAQILPPQMPLQPDSSVVYGKLDNGLTYYIKHNQKPAQRADFYIVTNVGAIQETPAQDGLAHFLEHMCLNGTKNFPGKGIISYMESIGAKFGENINAWTSVESTAYMLNNIPVIREGIIDSSLLILHDYSAFVTNDFDEIDKERGVILEEKRTRNTAQWRYRNAAFEALFKGTKYATCSLIGSEENLKTFDPQELVNFYKTWYRPDMQAIIVVGDVDPKAVERKIKSLFGELPKAENPKAKDIIPIPGNEEPIVAIFTDKENASTSVEVYFKGQPLPREYRGLGMAVLMDIYKSLITSMMNERFSDISASPNAPFLGAGSGFAPLCVTMEAFYGAVQSKDAEAVPALEAMFVELERAKRFGFTQAEFERAKTQLLKSYEVAAANASGRQNGAIVNDYINNFISGDAFTTPEYKYSVVKGYLEGGAIQLEAINQMMASLVTDNNMVVIYSGPEKEGLINPVEEEILGAIAAAKASDIKPLEGENVNEPLLDAASLPGSTIMAETGAEFGSTRIELANGIEIYIKPTEFKKDEVMFKIVANGGKSILPTELLPALEQNVLMMYQGYQGISDFPVTKLQKMLTGKAVRVSPFISSLEQGVQGSGSPKDFETMLQLTYLYYVAPRFEASEMEVGINQIKAVLPNMMQQPDFINSLKMSEIMYGNSPRVPVIGEQMLKQATVENYKKAYEQLFSDVAGAKMYITGNVDIEQIKPLLEKYIGSLPVKSDKGLMWQDDNTDIVKGKVEEIFEVPMEAPKTKVTLVYSADMERNLKNDILSEALQNVLDLTYTKSIREEEGGTYGVGVLARTWANPKDGMFLLIQFDTEFAKAPKLIEIAISELEDIAANGVNEEYVAKTKENMLKAFPEKHIQNSYWLNTLYNNYSQDYNVDYNYENTVSKVVTSKEIQEYVKQMLKQGNRIKIVMNPKQ